MSKRVQYAQSFPIVTSVPVPEAGRIVEYFKADGMYYMLPNGTSVGPITAGGVSGANVVTSANPTANKLTVSPLASPPASPVDGDQWIVSDYNPGGVLPPKGTLIDLAERSYLFDVPSTTVSFVDGMVVTVPPQDTPYEVSFSATCVLSTGTSGVGAFESVMVFMLDQITGFTVGYAAASGIQVVAAGPNKAWQTTVFITRTFPPNTVTRYFRVYARLGNAIPANWLSSTVYAENAPDSGNYPPMQMKAVTA